MEEEKNILEELKGYLSLNIEISKQNAEDIYFSTKDSGCANVYLGKMIAFTEALSKLKSLTEEEKNNMETDEYVMTDIIFDPEDKRLIHLKGKLVYAGNTPMEVLKEANGKSVSSYSVGAIGAMRRELGSVKKMFIAVLFQTGVAWILAVAIFGIGSLLLVI